MGKSNRFTHDAFAKRVFSNPKIFSELVEQFCPKSITTNINLASLELVPMAHVTEEFKQLFPDLAFDCKLVGGRAARLIFLLENKTHLTRFPQVQLFQYQSARWAETAETERFLAPILPIILYHGQKKWKKKPFSASFGPLPSEFQAWLPSLDYVLIDLAAFSDEQLLELKQSRLVNSLLVMKHCYDKRWLLENMESVFMPREFYISSEDRGHFFADLFHYFCEQVQIKSQKEHGEIVSKIKKIMKEQDEDYFSLYDSIVLEGLTEGKIEGKIEAIRGFLLEFPDYPDYRIAKILNCTEDLVRTVRAEFRQSSLN